MTSFAPGAAPPGRGQVGPGDGTANALQGDPAPIDNRLGLAIRVLSHLVVWTVVLVPTALQMAEGWRALNDDATISLRSFQVLSLHPPLLGHFSTVSYHAGNTLFDPGPLLYWLLAVPVHIDPAQGGLWGGALCCGVALSVAIEAMKSKGSWLGGALIALGAVDLAWLLPEVFAHAMWNPFFGLLFLVSTVAMSWIVATGSLGWWPVVVFTASVTAQADLIFSILAVAVAVASLILGLLRAGRPKRMRWLVVGLGVGVICWLPTLVQQVTGAMGNLALIFDARGKEAAAGLAFGFRSLALAGAPSPIWLVHAAGFGNVPMLDKHPAGTGVVVLGAVAVLAVVAWRAGRNNLAALAAIGVVCSVAVVVTFADVPKANEVNLIFLMYCLWVVGILLWVIFAWAVVDGVGVGVRHWVGRRSPEGSSRQDAVVWIGRLAALCGLGGVLLLGVTAVRGLASQAAAEVNGYRVGQLGRAVAAIEKTVPAGPVAIDFRPNYGVLTTVTMEFAYGTGVGWQLTVDGWQPALPAVFTNSTGVVYPHHADWPTVAVTLIGNRTLSVRRLQ